MEGGKKSGSSIWAKAPSHIGYLYRGGTAELGDPYIGGGDLGALLGDPYRGPFEGASHRRVTWGRETAWQNPWRVWSTRV